MANLNFKAFQDTIKQYAIDHVDVQHTVEGRVAFCRMEADEDVNGVAQSGAPVLVIMDDFSGRTIGAPDERQMVQSARLIFVAYANTTNGESPREIESAQSLSEAIMLQFESRMWNDYQEDDCGLFRNMIWEQTSYEPIDGPFLSSYYGWIMTINFKNIKPAFEPLKWRI